MTRTDWYQINVSLIPPSEPKIANLSSAQGVKKFAVPQLPEIKPRITIFGFYCILGDNFTYNQFFRKYFDFAKIALPRHIRAFYTWKFFNRPLRPKPGNPFLYGKTASEHPSESGWQHSGLSQCEKRKNPPLYLVFNLTNISRLFGSAKSLK